MENSMEALEDNKEILAKIEWLNTRKNYITASGVSSLMYKRTPKETDILGVDLNTAEIDLLVSSLTMYDYDDAFAPSRAAAWGHENEANVLGNSKSFYHWDDAIITKDMNKGKHLYGIGCSPDGLDIPQPEGVKLPAHKIDAKHGAEIKSFGAKRHLEIVLTGDVPEEIQDQVAWYFQVIDTLEDVTLIFDCPKVVEKNLRRKSFLFTREQMKDRSNLLLEAAKKSIKKINSINF